jgi:hypothetical protein
MYILRHIVMGGENTTSDPTHLHLLNSTNTRQTTGWYDRQRVGIE